METYIVRIYRRSREDPREMVGLVENAATERKVPFKNRDELMAILSGRMDPMDIGIGKVSGERTLPDEGGVKEC